MYNLQQLTPTIYIIHDKNFWFTDNNNNMTLLTQDTVLHWTDNKYYTILNGVEKNHSQVTVVGDFAI